MNEDTFLAALRDSPADDVTWLALADWLDEDGQADRAELLRLTRRLRTLPPDQRNAEHERVAAMLEADVRPVVVERVNSVGMRFALVPAGRYLMGSPPREKGRKPDETQHEVEITKAFYLGVFQVTQAQWRAVMRRGREWAFSAGGENARRVETLDTQDFPAERLRFEDVQKFLKKLNGLKAEQTPGWEYRLPSEAEWEYACRGAGISKEPFLFKAPSATLHSSHVNYDGNYPYGGKKKGPYLARTCPVGSYAPNPLGIYDMHGNVWEWCSDWYAGGYYKKSRRRDPLGPTTGSDHVIRGGSWDSVADSCRAANRRKESLAYRNSVLGFRVACGTLPG
jgi:formylglycine-generating enzyme